VNVSITTSQSTNYDASLCVIRQADDPRNFRTVQPHSVNPQIIDLYPTLHNAINEADKRYEECSKYPDYGYAHPPCQSNYCTKLSVDDAKNFTNDLQLNFSEISTGDPTVKGHNALLKIVDKIFSIIAYYK